MIGHRTLKRVPMDFDWPIDTVWNGYLRPHKAGKRWRPKEPPKGEGYQLWEIISEGSPMSPVFATPEELADWCETNATLSFSTKVSAAEWLILFQKSGSLEVASLGHFEPGISTEIEANL